MFFCSLFSSGDFSKWRFLTGARKTKTSCHPMPKVPPMRGAWVCSPLNSQHGFATSLMGHSLRAKALGFNPVIELAICWLNIRHGSANVTILESIRKHEFNQHELGVCSTTFSLSYMLLLFSLNATLFYQGWARAYHETSSTHFRDYTCKKIIDSWDPSRAKCPKNTPPEKSPSFWFPF